MNMGLKRLENGSLVVRDREDSNEFVSVTLPLKLTLSTIFFRNIT